MSATLQKSTPLFVVEDVAASLRFYVEQLGFETEYTYGDPLCFAAIQRNGQHLMLDTPENDAHSEARRALPAYANTILYFHVDDVVSLREEFIARGVKAGPLADQFYGLREFYLRDPDGYELGFGQRIEPEPRGN